LVSKKTKKSNKKKNWKIKPLYILIICIVISIFGVISYLSYDFETNTWKINWSNSQAGSMCLLSSDTNKRLPLASGVKYRNLWGHTYTVPSSPSLFYIPTSSYYQTNFDTIFYPFVITSGSDKNKMRIGTKKMINFITFAGFKSRNDSRVAAGIAIGDSYSVNHASHDDGK